METPTLPPADHAPHSNARPVSSEGVRGNLGRLRILARLRRRHATPARRALWRELRRRQLGVKFRRQALVGGVLVDFFARRCRLAVVLHDQPGIGASRRAARLERLGIHVVQFSTADVLRDFDAAVWRVRAAIAQGWVQ